MNKTNKTRAEIRKEIEEDSEAWLRESLEDIGGTGFGLKLGEKPIVPLDRISTGSIKLDRAIGGGIPRGRITEIYGPTSQGKTTLCYSIMGQAQLLDKGDVGFIDAEQTWDSKWAKVFGVDPEKIWHVEPDSGEQGLTALHRFVDSGKFSLVVVDSVAALVPESMLRGEVGDAHMGVKARMMSTELSKLAPTIKRNNTAVVFTNQMRINIGQMFGNPEVTTGGEALKYYASLRLAVRQRGDFIKEGDTKIGMNIRVYAQKNKTATPFRDAELRLMYDGGFDFLGDAIDIAVEDGILEKGGAWYHWNGQKWNGKEKLLAFLRNEPESYDVLMKALDKK